MGVFGLVKYAPLSARLWILKLQFATCFYLISVSHRLEAQLESLWKILSDKLILFGG